MPPAGLRRRLGGHMMARGDVLLDGHYAARGATMPNMPAQEMRHAGRHGAHDALDVITELRAIFATRSLQPTSFTAYSELFTR